MAKKRKLPGDAVRTEEEEEPELPGKYQDQGWRDWLFHEFLRYWYVLGVALLDFLLALELARVSQGVWASVLPALFISIVVPLEYLLYKRIWVKREKDAEQ